MDFVLRRVERRWRGEDPDEGWTYLRWLERSAAPEPEVLGVRLALGDLPLERLRLAAYAGHAAARDLLGEEAPFAQDDVEGWVLGLAQWGKRACALAATAAAEASLPMCERHRPGDRRPWAVVQAVQQFLRAPDPEARAGAVQQAVWDATFTGPFMPVAYNLGACAISTRRAEVSAEDGAVWAAEAAGAAEHLIGEAVRASIGEALARWALAPRRDSGGLTAA